VEGPNEEGESGSGRDWPMERAEILLLGWLGCYKLGCQRGKRRRQLNAIHKATKHLLYGSYNNSNTNNKCLLRTNVSPSLFCLSKLLILLLAISCFKLICCSNIQQMNYFRDLLGQESDLSPRSHSVGLNLRTSDASGEMSDMDSRTTPFYMAGEEIVESNQIMLNQQQANKSAPKESSSALLLQLSEGRASKANERYKLNETTISNVRNDNEHKIRREEELTRAIDQSGANRSSTLEGERSVRRIGHKGNRFKFEESPLPTNEAQSLKVSQKDGNGMNREDRIETRHKFSFTVNGRELALEPPIVVGGNKGPSVELRNSSSRSRSQAKVQSGSIKKVNRIGDFISPDYESGFDVSSEPETNNALAGASTNFGSSGPVKPYLTSNLSSSKARGESTSSSLMSPQTQSDLDETTSTNNESAANDDQSGLSSSGADGHNMSPARASEQSARSQAGDSGANKIISDWPKAKASDRHSASSLGAKPKGQGEIGPRFSVLLGANGASNEFSGRPADQQGWDAKQWPQQTRSNNAVLAGVKLPTKTPSTAETSAPNQNDNDHAKITTNPKRNLYPKAPAQARARYTSSIAAQFGLTADAYPKLAANVSHQTTRPKIHISASTFPSNPRPTAPLVVESKNSTTLASKRATLPEPRNSISEYRTNFTLDYVGTPEHSQTSIGRKQKTVDRNDGANKSRGEVGELRKAPIVQRDLSYKMQPSEISGIQLSGRLESPGGQPFNANRQHLFDGTKILNESSSPLNVGQSNVKPAKQLQVAAETSGRPGERLSSIVRTGPLLPGPLANQAQLRALVPAAVALLAQAQDQHSRTTAQRLRALLATHQQQQQQLLNGQNLALGLDYAAGKSSSGSASTSTGQNLSGVDQMIATSNNMGVSHLGPQSAALANFGLADPNSYNPLQDYPERQLAGSGGQVDLNGADPSMGSSPQASTTSSIMGDEQRSNYGENEMNSYETNSANGRVSNKNAAQLPVPSEQTTTNSRSSMSDVYIRPEQKASRDQVGGYPMRSMDPFEDVPNGISPGEFERDLADLDEEFNRQTSFRRPSSNQMMSDSYLSMSPERYEARARYNRRPSYDYSADYINAAGSISNIIPRAYQRSPPPWSSSSSYNDNSDLWVDSNGPDYNALASFVSPNHYSYRWRPRYQRISPYHSPYMTTSASEQHLQPAYNLIPSYTSAMPTETVSFTLSPLAAAAAAAASALAAAEKSRHHNHGWLIPRIAASALAPVPAPASPSASQPAALPTAIQAAYIQRPSPYSALSSVPIYAIAPRPAPPIATAASGTAPAIIPYFQGGGPAIIAYRPAGVLPSTSLLTAASFAYPFRLPVGAALPRPASTVGLPTRALAAVRPFSSDLQFAETKSKSNLTNSSDAKGSTKAGGLSAMARNLTKKMFGSASQIRPQHVAPPGTVYDMFALAQNSSSVSPGLQAI